jgi:hypothetical protein
VVDTKRMIQAMPSLVSLALKGRILELPGFEDVINTMHLSSLVLWPKSFMEATITPEAVKRLLATEPYIDLLVEPENPFCPM